MRYLSFRTLFLLTTSVVVCFPVSAKPVFDVISLFNKDKATINRSLGQPTNSHTNPYGEFSDYQTTRGKLTVKFNGGNARSFLLSLDKTEKTAVAAVALMGVSVKGKTPAEQTQFQVKWYGPFGKTQIKYVSATNYGAGFKTVVAADSE